jgi:hypothetical protein
MVKACDLRGSKRHDALHVGHLLGRTHRLRLGVPSLIRYRRPGQDDCTAVSLTPRGGAVVPFFTDGEIIILLLNGILYL